MMSLQSCVASLRVSHATMSQLSKHTKPILQNTLVLRTVKTQNLTLNISTRNLASIARLYDDNSIIKSKSDKRKYCGLELSNGMKVLLISDPKTDMSAAAMNIQVGSMKDPRHLPGLAHFCEHMLFLGTEKYPKEDEYTKFLSEHGGHSNASTGLEDTNYFFDVAPDHLAGALDRFAQFFIQPLFDPSAVEREVNAVDNENKRNVKIDSRRLFQLLKSLARPDHDFNKFSTGNKYTLETLPKSQGLDIRDELIKFHSNFYSSNVMGCCVLGKEDIDTLQEMVVPLLENVANKNIDIPEWKDPPFTESELQRTIFSSPIKDNRFMTVMWPTPDMSQHYKQKPSGYLGHLIGHEGQGSLLSELKARGWVNFLSGGQTLHANGFAFFGVTVDLTLEGQDHTDEIVSTIYQYINMLREVGPQEWIFDECKGLEAMRFNFKDCKEDPSGYTSSLSRSLQRRPMEDILSAHALYGQFKPDLVSQILDKLTPQNMLIEVVSKKYEEHLDQTEHWYGTPYQLKDFSKEQTDAWSRSNSTGMLHLPRKNEFIPSDFTLAEKDSDVSISPSMIKNTPFSRLWFKQDSQFLKPKVCVSIDLKNSVAYKTPLNANLNYLFVQLFDDSITELSYDAALAGLGYSLGGTVSGLRLSVGGYNDKMMVLIEFLMDKLTNFTVDKNRLDIFIEDHRRQLNNFVANQPYQQASYYTSLLTSDIVWTYDDLLSALDDVTAERVQSYIKESLSKVFIEGLIYGNINQTESLKIMDMVEDKLVHKYQTKVLPKSEFPVYRALKLPEGCYFVKKEINTVHENYGTIVYYQCGRQNTQSNMLLGLFCQLISEPCFSILRTQEQLGYIVSSGPRRSEGVQGFKVLVQSSKDSDYVESRIEAFIQHVCDIITDMSDETFESHKQALITNILEQPKSMMEQHSIFLSEIISDFYLFNRDEVEVEFLRTLTKQDVFNFYKENIAEDAIRRRKLVVHVVPKFPGEAKVEDTQDESTLLSCPVPNFHFSVMVSNISAFKQGLKFYPPPEPTIDLNEIV